MKLRDAGDSAIGFFYYSGHGVANPETRANYLIPIDVRSIADKDIWLYAFEQNTIIDRLSAIAANATHFVVFDACRDELITPASRAKSARQSKGFVPIATKAGLLVAYSTAPGATASDEGAGGGPYARILAEELAKPGIEAVAMFRRVQLRVRARIQQDPWLSFPALPEIYLAGRPPADGAPDNAAASAGPVTKMEDHEPPRMAPMSAAAKAWIVTQHSNNAAILEAFANEFPESIFAKFARARIADLARHKSDRAQSAGFAVTRRASQSAAERIETAQLLCWRDRRETGACNRSSRWCASINVPARRSNRRPRRPRRWNPDGAQSLLRRPICRQGRVRRRSLNLRPEHDHCRNGRPQRCD